MSHRSVFLADSAWPLVASAVPVRYRASLGADLARRCELELAASTFRFVRRSRRGAHGRWTEQEWLELKVDGRWVRA